MSVRYPLLSFFQRHSRLLTWLVLYLALSIISSRHLGFEVAVIATASTMITMVLLSVLMRYLLLPYLVHEHRVLFFFSILASLSVLCPLAINIDLQVYEFMVNKLNYTLPSHVVDDIENQNRIFLLCKYSVLLLSTAAVESISYLIKERKELDQKFKEEQMQNRLKYLRAQINPHFLFNSLNCIYALTVTQDEKAPDSVLKLSEMLRYVIDDCSQERVLLQKEVNYIRNYIDFQRIRMESDPNLTFDCRIADPNYTIPPMILQPMIENCFKHSRIVDDPRAWIRITLCQDAQGLLFTAENSIPQGNAFSTKDDERTGIGLENVVQRLEMLFGDKCSFKTIEEKSRYKTIVHIS